jgi:hypothetical protein
VIWRPRNLDMGCGSKVRIALKASRSCGTERKSRLVTGTLSFGRDHLDERSSDYRGENALFIIEAKFLVYFYNEINPME